MRSRAAADRYDERRWDTGEVCRLRCDAPSRIFERPASSVCTVGILIVFGLQKF